MSGVSEQKLAEALDALARGDTVEQVLARFPAEAAELRPALEVAARLASLRVAHSLDAQARSRQAMLAHAEAVRAGAGPQRAGGLFGRFVFSLATLALLLIVFGGGLLAVSGRAVPGDALYGAKRFAERARLSIAADPTRQHQLEDEFLARRIEEIWTLFAAGRQEWVDFGGPIESLTDDLWLIGGVPVRLTDTTVLQGDPQVGVYAWVEGDTGAGEVIASLVEVRGEATPTPEPERPPVTPERPVVAPTLTPSPSPDPSATATPSPTASPSATPSATATFQPTATPSPTATETWVPPVNENDNSNDNDDGNLNENEPDDNTNDNEPDDNVNDNQPNDNVNDNESDDDNVLDNDVNNNEPNDDSDRDGRS